MFQVDLNSDLGESFGAFSVGMDEQVIQNITSANVACGFHAGEPMVMGKTVQTAAQNRTAVGAHPGFLDLMGFGRRDMRISSDEAKAYVLYQLGAIAAFCKAHRTPLQHVKAHGALYNMAAKDYSLARAIGEAIKAFDSQVIYCGLPGSMMQQAAEDLNLTYACEAFADRAYMPDGTLVPRGQKGAMIEDPELAAKRVLRMVKEGKVETIEGGDIPIRCDTVCLHGDSAHAVAFAQKLRQALEANGVRVAPMREIV